MKARFTLAAVLVAMLAMTAVTTATAAASPPEVGRCAEKSGIGSKYEDVACTKRSGTGKYEWLELAKRSFKTTSSEPATWAWEGNQFVCKGGMAVEGEVEGFTKFPKGTIRFTECRYGSLFMKTNGAKSEELVFPVSGELQYYNEGTEPTIGMRLETTSTVKGKVGQYSVEWKGALAGRIKSENKMTKKEELEYNSKREEVHVEHPFEMTWGLSSAPMLLSAYPTLEFEEEVEFRI